MYRYMGNSAARCERSHQKKSSEEEHRADAQAPSAEEGRGKLRKATVSRKQALTRRSPNGETRRTEGPSLPDDHIVWREVTRGTETSTYPEEEKERSIPLVAASERGRAQTIGYGLWGCGPAKWTMKLRGIEQGSSAREGDSPVVEKRNRLAGTRVPQCTRNPAGSREDHLPRLNTAW